VGQLFSGTVSGGGTFNQGAGSTPITFTGTGGTPNYTFNYTLTTNGVTGPVQSISTTGGASSVVINHPRAVPGTFVYTLVGISESSGNCTGTIGTPSSAQVIITAGAPLPGPDLTSSQLFTTTQLQNGQSLEEVIALRNVGSGPTSGQIVFHITTYTPLTGLTVVPLTQPTVTIGADNYVLDNPLWTWDPANSRFTSNIVIPPGGVSYIGIRISRSGGVNGTVTQTTTIPPGTGGGEAPSTNNSISNSILKIN
jgi:hypothetical protein